MQRAKKLMRLNLLLLGLLFLSIALIDQPLAEFINAELTLVQPFFNYFTLAADKVAIHIFYIMVACSGLGLIFLMKRKTIKAASVLLTLVFTLLISSFITNTMKSQFKRVRPDVYLKVKAKTTDFYSNEIKDYSFPSSHTSFYLSLFLPGALVFKRFAPALFVVPGVIIVGRVLQNEHYLSDVLCSIIIVLNLCSLILGLFYLLHIKLKVKVPNSKESVR